MKSAEIFTSYKVVEVNGEKIVIKSEKETRTIDDTNKIVIATGMKSYIHFDYAGTISAHIIGDAKQVGKAQEAIHDAYELALNL